MKLFYIYLIFQLFLSVVSLHSTETKKSTNTTIPIIFSSTEMGVGLGFTTIYTYKSKFENKKLNTLSTTAFYTTKNQSAFFLVNEHFINQKYKYKLALKWMNFPTNFYGTGIDTEFKNQEKITSQRLGATPSILKQLNKNSYFGLVTDIGKYNISNDEPNKTLSNFSNFKGYKESTYLGAGFEFDYNTKNNNFYPSSGNVLKTSALFYKDNFYKQEIKYTNFTKILLLENLNLKFNNWILGSNIQISLSQGETPLWLLPRIKIRGIESNRFNDKNAINIEEEIRFQISKRIKANVFVGAGNISDNLSTFEIQKTKFGAGFGLRFVINEEQKINLILDFTFHNVKDDEKSMYFYFQVLERF